MAATVSGTMAPGTPSDVPTTKRVNGMMATSKMMNGMERPMFTIQPSTVFSARCGRRPSLAVTTNSTPSGTPMTYAKNVDTMVMTIVSHVPCANSAPYWAMKLLM